MEPRDARPNTGRRADPAETVAATGRATSSLSLPARIGRFEVLQLLGGGGFGVVYRARDPQLDREVAVKVLRPEALGGPEARERFLREARAAARVRHANLCPLYEAHADGPEPYLVLALLRGPTLDAWLRERGGPLPAGEAARLTRKLAVALAALHAAGIVHRDLKPANVLLDNGEPIVTDFGLARLGGDAALTQAGVVLGTPAYMAPEQAAGATHEVGPGADVYALGVVLYEMLAGRLPYHGSITEVLAQAARGEPAPPSTHQPATDRRLEAICLTALAKDPARRFPSMDAFAAALDAYLMGSDAVTVAVPSPVTHRRLPWLPIVVGSGCLGAVLLILLGVFVAMHLFWPSTEPDPIIGPNTEAPLPRELRRLDMLARVRGVHILPDGKHGLVSCSETIDDRHQGELCVWDFEQNAKRHQSTQANISRSAVHPNGERALIDEATSNTIFLVTLEGGRLSMYRPQLPAGSVSCLAFAPNGKWFVCGVEGSRSVVVAFDVTTKKEAWRGQSRLGAFAGGTDRMLITNGRWIDRVSLRKKPRHRVLREHPGEIAELLTLPDGKHFLTIDRHPRPTARRWEVDTGRPAGAIDLGHDGNVLCTAISADGTRLLTGGADHTARLHDLASEKSLAVLRGHTGPVGAVALAPDGRTALTGSHDRTARFWQLP